MRDNSIQWNYFNLFVYPSILHKVFNTQNEMLFYLMRYLQDLGLIIIQGSRKISEEIIQNGSLNHIATKQVHQSTSSSCELSFVFLKDIILIGLGVYVIRNFYILYYVPVSIFHQ